MAFNRTRYFHYLRLLGENLKRRNPRKLLGQLERSYIRTLNSLESRRRQNPQLGKPDKLIISGSTPDRQTLASQTNDLEPKTEGTNPATPTKQEPESRQVRRRRERLKRKKSRASDDIRDGLYG